MRKKRSGGRGRYQRGPRIRKNERIRAREIRVIGPDGKQIGVMSPAEALKMAKNVGLDLVEISSNARPPVCRILDFGKYKYEQSKKEKDNKKTVSKVKEVKFRVRVGEHDYMTKIKHAEQFLFKSSKVKLTLMFRGREMEHRDLGFDIIKRAVSDLEHIAVQDAPAKMSGRIISTMVSPLPEKKRELKYNHIESADIDDDEDDDYDEEE